MRLQERTRSLHSSVTVHQLDQQNDQRQLRLDSTNVWSYPRRRLVDCRDDLLSYHYPRHTLQCNC